MYKLCKTEESAARQRMLELGLLKMMCSRRYEDISVSELCDRMSVPRKSFYRYFSSKDGSLYALIDHTLMEYENFHLDYANGEKRTLHRELEHFFRFWMEHKPFLDALCRSGMSGIMIERAIAYSLSGYTIPNRFLMSETLEMRRQIMSFGVSGLMSMVISWHQEGYRQSPSDMAQFGVRLLSVPLFPNIDKLL